MNSFIQRGLIKCASEFPGLRKEALLKLTRRQKFLKELKDQANRLINFKRIRAGKDAVGAVSPTVFDPATVTNAINAIPEAAIRRGVKLKQFPGLLKQELSYIPDATKSVGRRINRKARKSLDWLKSRFARKVDATPAEKAVYEQLDLPFDTPAAAARKQSIEKAQAEVRSKVGERLARKTYAEGTELPAEQFLPGMEPIPGYNNMMDEAWKKRQLLDRFGHLYGDIQMTDLDKLRRKARRRLLQANRFRKNHPYYTAAIAGGTGLLTGMGLDAVTNDDNDYSKQPSIYLRNRY